MLLSFIIPAYNAENFIIDTLNSISREISNVNKDIFEVIIINDGSIDRTLNLVQKFIVDNVDLNIKVFSKENGGLSDARNYGITRAKGEYIWFFDSDDLIETNCLSKILLKITSEDIDLLSIGIRDCFETGKKIEANIKDKPESIIDPIIYLSNYSVGQSAWCYLFKRSIVIDNNILFLKGVLSEDYDFTWRLIEKCQKIASLNEVCYNYMIRNGSLSRRSDDVYYRFHHLSMIKIFSNTNDYLTNLENKPYFKALLPYYSQLKIIALITLLKSNVPKKEKMQYFSEMKKNKVLEIVKPKVFTWKEFIIMSLVKLNLYSLILKFVSK